MFMNGILLVDKPVGWTSHDVVAKIRSNLKKETGQRLKVGHAGTLDPAATGLLVVLVGNYTKRAGEFSKLDKTYEAELTLGAISSTGDTEGEISQKSTKKPSLQQIEDILSQFKGKIQQTPHRYSAVKVGGKRAYKIARAGEEVKIESRQVQIYALKLQKYDYPKLQITTKVSSGTYIRSLAEDIGQKLGTGAYLSSLRRTQIAQFDIKEALKIDKLQPPLENLLQK